MCSICSTGDDEMKTRIFALFSRAALVAFCLIGMPAFGQILPDTGRWVNLNEPGRNFSIEIQDNQLTLHTQLYDENGWPVWYFSQGQMTSSHWYQGTLGFYTDGQCMGCPPQTPTYQGSMGWWGIWFTSPRTAILYWPGNPDGLDLVHRDSAIGLGTVYAALGEWAIVAGSEIAPWYFGERITFDWVANDGSGDYLDGYRTGDFPSRAFLWYDPEYDAYWGILFSSDGWDTEFWFQFYGQQTIRGWTRYYEDGTVPTEDWYPFVGFRMKSAARVELGVGPGMEESFDLDDFEP